MSFYSVASKSYKNCPGLVSSQESYFIKEKVCVQVKKVYDACLQQDILEDEVITIVPDNCSFARPLTFIGCRNVSSKGIMKNLKVDRLEDRTNFARVRTDVCTELKVDFIDADGMKGTGTTLICIPKDVILFVPDESIIPFEIEATVGATCADGKFIEDYTFEVDLCYTIILKVIAVVELLIPAFGFCDIPPCEEFSENICSEFFGLPLFPPQLEDIHCRTD